MALEGRRITPTGAPPPLAAEEALRLRRDPAHVLRVRRAIAASRAEMLAAAQAAEKGAADAE